MKNVPSEVDTSREPLKLKLIETEENFIALKKKLEEFKL